MSERDWPVLDIAIVKEFTINNDNQHNDVSLDIQMYDLKFLRYYS